MRARHTLCTLILPFGVFCFFFPCSLLLLCFHFIYFYLPPPLPPPPLLHMLLDSFIIFRIYFTVLFTEGRTFARLFGEISIWCIYSIFWRFAQTVYRAQRFVDSLSTLTTINVYRSLQVAVLWLLFPLAERHCCLFCPAKRIHYVPSQRNGNFDFGRGRGRGREKTIRNVWCVCVCLMSTAASSHCVRRKHTNR